MAYLLNFRTSLYTLQLQSKKLFFALIFLEKEKHNVIEYEKVLFFIQNKQIYLYLSTKCLAC